MSIRARKSHPKIQEKYCAKAKSKHTNGDIDGSTRRGMMESWDSEMKICNNNKFTKNYFVILSHEGFYTIISV